MTESYVTIATDDISCLGCLVLCNSLKQTGTEKLISVLVNPTVSYHLKNVLKKSFDKIVCTNDLYVISDGRNRFDVSGEYEKLKCWLLTDFTKCVFLESDVIVVENIDDLFDRFELSATSDPRWPDCFDTGVFVFSPCLKTYKQLIDYSINNLIANNSFQCLLNMYFCDWSTISMERKLPFVYNCQMNTTFYTQTAALVNFGHSIKAARLGHSVFNLMQPEPPMGGINHNNWSRLWNQWWKIFNEMVKPAIYNDDSRNFKRTGCDYGGNSTSECEGSEFSISELFYTSKEINSVCEPGSNRCEHRIENITKENFDQTSCVNNIPRALVGNEENVSKNVIDCDIDKERQLRWERGDIDYMGEDSFINILAKLNSSLTAPIDTGDRISDSEE